MPGNGSSQSRRSSLSATCPSLRTIVLLDEGMGSSAVRGSFDQRMEAWVATCNLLAKAFYEARPDIEVVAWTYTFEAPTPDRAKWDQRMERFCRLDRRVAYMSDFDARWMRRRDGVLQYAYDYSLSLKAPSEDFRHAAEYLLAESRRNKLPPRTLFTHIESRFSQESNTQPEIPCMQRWIQRYQAVNDFDTPPIKGMIANWYHQGFFPTTVTELFGWWSYTNPPAADDLLQSLARRDFGPAGSQAAIDAWGKFSEAIWHYPFWYGLSYPMNAGLAQPFWLDSKAINPRPWRRGFVNSLKELGLSASAGESRARLKALSAIGTRACNICARRSIAHRRTPGPAPKTTGASRARLPTRSTSRCAWFAGSMRGKNSKRPKTRPML